MNRVVDPMKSAFLLLAVGLMASGHASAQMRRGPAVDRAGVWLSPSFGINSMGASVGLAVQAVSRHVLTTLSVQSFAGVQSRTDKTSALTELALRVGPILHRGTLSAAVSTGIAFVGTPRKSSLSEPYLPTVGSKKPTESAGLPVEAQVLLQATPFIGFGARASVNFNRIETFGGMALTVQVGKLW